MADAIPVPVTPAISSYNYSDIAAGIGYQSFYGSVYTSGAVGRPPTTTDFYQLVSNTSYSNRIVVSGAVIQANAGGYISNNNYDMTFNLPQNIKGMAFLNLTICGAWGSGGTGSACVVYVSGATLQNVTQGVTLGSAMFSDNVQITSTTGQSKTLLIPFDCTSQVYHFKKGDTLRVNIPLWGDGGSGAILTSGGYGSDPKARSDPQNVLKSTDTSQMVLYLPFLLNNL